MKYLYSSVVLFLITCSENKISSHDLIGRWEVINQEYITDELVIKDKADKKLYDSITNKVKESFKNVNGFYMIFRKDSTYYSSKQPNHMSNWILDKNNSVIIFSDTKKPFIANYWIETVSLFNDTLILEDKIKNGFIKITLKK